MSLDLISMLPLLRGWRYSPLDVDAPFVVPAGETKVVDEATKPGWFHSGMVSLDNPDTELVVESYGPYRGLVRSTMRPSSLYAAGMVTPTPAGPWLSRYDDVDKAYVIVYAPSIPLPFGYRYRIAIRAPKTAPVTVLNYTHLLIIVEEPEVFAQSLRELMGVPTVEMMREVLRIGPPCPNREEKASPTLKSR